MRGRQEVGILITAPGHQALETDSAELRYSLLGVTGSGELLHGLLIDLLAWVQVGSREFS